MKRQTAQQPRQPHTAHQKVEVLNARQTKSRATATKKGRKRATISQSQPHSKSFGH